VFWFGSPCTRFNVRMLVEREDGLATLAAAHAQAMDGHGRLVFVGGEAGVGKTTIVTEFARSRCGAVSATT
jgi:tRNA A37 threonylcarbamoyladenosine biosynthesis protein TsaE